MWAKNRSKFECSEFYENSTIYHSMSEKSVHVFTDSGWNSNLAIVDYLTWINTLKSKCRWSIAICITLIKWAETWYKDNISNAVPYFPVCAISWHGVDRMCVCVFVFPLSVYVHAIREYVNWQWKKVEKIEIEKSWQHHEYAMKEVKRMQWRKWDTELVLRCSVARAIEK